MTRARAASAWLVVVVALAYANAFDGAFQFDDFNVIVDNPAAHSWPAWWASMPGLRPLLKASYVLSWRMDLGAAGFHLFNLAVHAGNALLVFALLRRWLADLAPGADAARAAFVAALVFALHPAQTEAVTYVCGRSTGLMALCWLGSIYAWERGRAAAGAWRVASVALFVAAMSVKEIAWTLPFALVLVTLARGGRWRAAFASALPQFAALALTAVAILGFEPYRRLLATSFATRAPLANLAAQGEGVWYLVSRPLLALRLSIDPDPVVPDASGMAQLAAAGVLAALLTAGFVALRRRPVAGFALLWFLLQLAPTNSLVARLDLVNDRQLYLALIGPALAVGIAVARLRAPRAATAVTCALALLLFAATVARNGDYRSGVALWEATVQASPGKARAWNNLGYAYRQEGDGARAAAAYERALRIDPEFHKARVNLELLRAE